MNISFIIISLLFIATKKCKAAFTERNTFSSTQFRE